MGKANRATNEAEPSSLLWEKSLPQPIHVTVDMFHRIHELGIWLVAVGYKALVRILV